MGHTGRALTTLESYSANPASQVTLHRPVDYLTQALDSLANPSQVVAQRGKEAGQALGNDPKEAIGETAHRVLTLVDQLPDSLIIGLPIGGIRLIDYLPSRVMELTIHTLDLAAALELRIQPPPPALTVTLRLLADLATETTQGGDVALALAGRQPLPEGFNLLG
ncbi:MAG: maleylpyruvate isomerase N-terminal domain-containing protein [Chloroflexi bacterium]|nr:maleylpyruvate isomerase N-terminal domain-containing protein [Chloroflexota bacterium]